MTKEEVQKMILDTSNEQMLKIFDHLEQSIHGAVNVAINDSVDTAIRKYVNGKIDRLSQSIADNAKIVSDHILRVEPAMEQFEKFTLAKSIGVSLFKVVASIGGGLMAIGGAYEVIKTILHK